MITLARSQPSAMLPPRHLSPIRPLGWCLASLQLVRQTQACVEVADERLSGALPADVGLLPTCTLRLCMSVLDANVVPALCNHHMSIRQAAPAGIGIHPLCGCVQGRRSCTSTYNRHTSSSLAHRHPRRKVVRPRPHPSLLGQQWIVAFLSGPSWVDVT